MLVLISAEPGGRAAAAGSRLDIPEIIRERSPDWIRLAEAKGIDLGFELDPVQVRGDGLLLGEMIANLVINAITYTPAPGEVTVRCRRGSDLAEVEVEDSGPGIPEAARELVFERFYRLPTSTAPGSGLGLAIVREIAGRFGGQAAIVAPRSGTGTLVRVSLPASA